VNTLGLLLPTYTVFVIQLSKYRRNIKAIIDTKKEQQILIEEGAICDDYDCEIISDEEVEDISKNKLHIGGIHLKKMKQHESSSSLMSPKLSINSKKLAGSSVLAHTSISEAIIDNT
jgi:hypothetical protein